MNKLIVSVVVMFVAGARAELLVHGVLLSGDCQRSCEGWMRRAELTHLSLVAYHQVAQALFGCRLRVDPYGRRRRTTMPLAGRRGVRSVSPLRRSPSRMTVSSIYHAHSHPCRWSSPSSRSSTTPLARVARWAWWWPGSIASSRTPLGKQHCKQHLAKPAFVTQPTLATQHMANNTWQTSNATYCVGPSQPAVERGLAGLTVHSLAAAKNRRGILDRVGHVRAMAVAAPVRADQRSVLAACPGCRSLPASASVTTTSMPTRAARRGIIVTAHAGSADRGGGRCRAGPAFARCAELPQAEPICAAANGATATIR